MQERLLDVRMDHKNAGTNRELSSHLSMPYQHSAEYEFLSHPIEAATRTQFSFWAHCSTACVTLKSMMALRSI